MGIESSILYFLLVVLPPFLGLFINLFFCKKNCLLGAKIGSFAIWTGVVGVFMAAFSGAVFSTTPVFGALMVGPMSWLIAALILFVSGVVHHFSLRYMEGDRKYRRYFLLLGAASVSTLFMAAADNLVLLSSCWLLSNFSLTLLMQHKSQWLAAKNSASLARRTFLLGFVFLTASMALLARDSGTLSLDLIVKNRETLSSFAKTAALLLMILASFTQSGIWPFHRWLISSLNSPTPVSALMHAGLVNGGALLLIRFAPIFFTQSVLLDILFLFGCVTLLLGGIWKLLQNDIKRMLACSTMTQMGFMMVQCSLGLFSAALAHLCWHGLFKAFLFLRSGSTIAEHREIHEPKPISLSIFGLSSLSGAVGVLGFIWGSYLFWPSFDARWVLLFFGWIAFTEVARVFLEKKLSFVSFLTASSVCLGSGIVYGLTVHLIEIAVFPMQISQPQPFGWIHGAGLSLMLCVWIALNVLGPSLYASFWWRWFYVTMLNASQPDPKTITFNRNEYKF